MAMNNTLSERAGFAPLSPPPLPPSLSRRSFLPPLSGVLSASDRPTDGSASGASRRLRLALCPTRAWCFSVCPPSNVGRAPGALVAHRQGLTATRLPNVHRGGEVVHSTDLVACILFHSEFLIFPELAVCVGCGEQPQASNVFGRLCVSAAGRACWKIFKQAIIVRSSSGCGRRSTTGILGRGFSGLSNVRFCLIMPVGLSNCTTCHRGKAYSLMQRMRPYNEAVW